MVLMRDEILDLSESELESGACPSVLGNSNHMASRSVEIKTSLRYHCPASFGLNFWGENLEFFLEHFNDVCLRHGIVHQSHKFHRLLQCLSKKVT